MPGRTYTDEERAAVKAELTINDGNVKRTARQTGVPVGTIRSWVTMWGRSESPVGLSEMMDEQAEDFVSAAEEVRADALTVLHAKLPVAKPGELITVIGVLTDKIDRARGLATRHITEVALPSPEAIRDTLNAALTGVLQSAHERQDVIDAEATEVLPLPLKAADRP